MHEVVGVDDGARQRQGEADEAHAERNRSRQNIGPDEREFVMLGSKHVNHEIEDDKHQGEPEELREIRQSLDDRHDAGSPSLSTPSNGHD